MVGCRLEREPSANYRLNAAGFKHGTMHKDIIAAVALNKAEIPVGFPNLKAPMKRLDAHGLTLFKRLSIFYEIAELYSHSKISVHQGKTRRRGARYGQGCPCVRTACPRHSRLRRRPSAA
ncbi:MAG: hypothetical protein WB764_10625 [Xanthobacteraceae bacterium]